MSFACRPPNNGGPGFVYSAIAGSANNSLVGGGTNTCVLTIRRDGTWQFSGTGGSQSSSPSGSQNWVTPGASTVGDGFWVRYTNTTGNAPNAGTLVANTWTQLNADRTVAQSMAPATSRSGDISVQIATDAAGANIVSTGTVTLSGDND